MDALSPENGAWTYPLGYEARSVCVCETKYDFPLFIFNDKYILL